MDNLNVLVEAKREYTEQLSILMCPAMIDVFDEIFIEAQKTSGGNKLLIMFQKLLKEVPNWNETMAKHNTDNIANRCAWFKDLVAAVFVSSVKILSAVRLSKDGKKLSVKLPSNEVFIHTCYKKAAKDLYINPYVFTDNQTEHERNDKLYDRFCKCIESTVKELIPIQEILQTYMTVKENELIEPQEADIMEDNVDEYDDPEPAPEPEPEQEPALEPEPEREPALEPEPEQEPGPVAEPSPIQSPSPFESEFKTIKTTNVPREPVMSDNDDLFSDAAETRR